MERFVQFVVAGGVALVAGLWLLRLAPTRPVWALGGALSAGGAGALAVGIGSEIELSLGVE